MVRYMLAALALIVAGVAWGASTPPSIRIYDAKCVAGQPCTFKVELVGTRSPTASLGTFTTVDATAKQGVDYSAAKGSILLTTGNSTTLVIVPTFARVGTGSRTFTVKVTKGANARCYDCTAVGTISPTPPGPPIVISPVPVTIWNDCAQENGICNFMGPGQVRYGPPGGPYSTTVVNIAFATEQSLGCNNGVFGDPAVGVAKVCQTTGKVLTPTPPPSPQPPVKCADGLTVPAGQTCPIVNVPANPCFGADGQPIIASWCPAKACPGVNIPVPAEQPCPLIAPLRSTGAKLGYVEPVNCDVSTPSFCHRGFGVETPLPIGWTENVVLAEGGYARPVNFLHCGGALVKIEALQGDWNAFLNLPVRYDSALGYWQPKVNDGARLWAVHFVTDGGGNCPAEFRSWPVVMSSSDLVAVAPPGSMPNLINATGKGGVA